MEEIAKIFKINKTGIMQTFIILIICSVAGNIIHDVIMLMENIGLVEKDYTVFPMGSFMVIIGILPQLYLQRQLITTQDSIWMYHMDARGRCIL